MEDVAARPGDPALPPETALPAPPPPDALVDVLLGLPDAVLVVSPLAELVWANPAAERLFGLAWRDSVGMSGLDLIHPEDQQIAAVSLTSVQGKEVGTPLEVRVLTHDGWRLVEVIGTTVDDHLVLSVRDLTDRRRWELAQGDEELFRSLLSYASFITLLVDRGGRALRVSPAVTRLLGHDQEQLEGRPLDELLNDDDASRWRAALAQVCDATHGDPTGSSITVDLELRCFDGSYLPMAITVKNLLDDPTVSGLVVSGHDISDRVAAEGALRSANSVLAATLESTADGILVVDRRNRIGSCNSRFRAMWSLPEGLALPGTEVATLAAMQAQAADPAILVPVDDDTDAGRDADVSGRPVLGTHDVIELVDGRTFERESLPQTIDGEVVGRVWSFRDVTATRVLQDELARQAFHDALTGLANQALFRNRVEHAIERLDRSGASAAVLFVDLDDFKTVNDSLGHQVGDELLVAVSDRLRTCLRAADTAARLGGDEFAVLIEDLDGDAHAVEVAERIVSVLREPVILESRRVNAGASVGIAFARPGSGVDATTLLRNADLAMYTAKGRGKGCHRVYEDEMHDAALARLVVEADLRGAAARGELVVHYQPIYELATGAVRAVEALVRWQHPEQGLIGPDLFIPLAESAGLIDEIGNHVLEASLREARRWKGLLDGDGPAVNVNLSPHQLLDQWLPDRVGAQLARCGVDPDRLVLEITESALMADPKMAAVNLRRLHDLGVQLAVDDFGTGYSSLAYLQRFPIDYLKIDGSFVDEMLVRPDGSMVEAIVQLSHTLGLRPIAEKVETADQEFALAAMGCDLVQGYHLSRPVDADAVAALLRSHHDALAESGRGS